jgi:hypothetical protein
MAIKKKKNGNGNLLKKKKNYKKKYIQYKNSDKQNTKMRRGLATAILLKKKQLKTKVKGE